MKAKRVFVCGIALAMLALAFAACRNPNQPGGTPDITYTVEQEGGVDGTTDSAGIVFTFSESVDSLNLTAANITVGGAAAKGMGELTGSGASRTLAITVSAEGTATVAIAKTGIEAETKNVAVYKGPPTLTSITAAYTPTTEIFPDTTHDTLRAGLTVTAHYSNGSKTLNDDDYALSGEFTVGESVITVTYTEGGVTATAEFTVTVNAPHSHNWSKSSETAPTCTTAGEETWVCTAINPSHSEIRAGAAIDPSAHDWGSYAETTAPTCTATGTETRICSLNPAHTEPQAVPINPNAHQYEWEVDIHVSDSADGEEKEFCQLTRAHPTRGTRTYAYAYGTAGLAFTLISGGANDGTYRVRKGTVGSGAVYIPAWHHPNVNASNPSNFTYPALSEYRPVTEIGSSTDSTYSGGGAFAQTAITAVNFTAGSQLTVIGYNAFNHCASLASITLPATVTTISGWAFSYCTSLTSVTIPATVTTMAERVFEGSGLQTVTFAPGFQMADFGWSFYGCTHLASITIPASVTTIQSQAFLGCTSLSSIIIPANVTLIRYQAFQNWTPSQTINIRGHSSEAAADAAWGNGDWRTFTNAVRKYWNGSSYQ